jgi:hypothetical protein
MHKIWLDNCSRSIELDLSFNGQQVIPNHGGMIVNLAAINRALRDVDLYNGGAIRR